MLRHPVLRSYSQWLYQWRLGTEHLSFGDALLAESSRLGSAEAELAADQHLVRFNHIHYSYALQSRYSALLSRWYQVFPPDQILVLVLEDLLGEEGAAAWARLCRHAGLEPAPVPAFQKWESIEWPLSPPAVLHSAEATLLRATLEDDVRSLRKLLNRGQLWPD
jgi:hypothetical protein